MASRKRTKARGKQVEAKAYDRTAADLPHGAQVVVSIEDDPYSPAGQTDKITVLRSIRDDPLAGMWARDQIDRTQFCAGRMWQRFWEQAGIAGVQAMDPTKEPVDGRGAMRPDITDEQLKAYRQLKAARDVMGLEGDRLLREILEEGLSIKRAAYRRGMISERGILYCGRRFGECLETLARLWGLA
jgi:hypothetical protein